MKSTEELIVEKHTHNLHAGYRDRALGIYPPSGAMGDFRWTDDLILATYYQAEFGEPPENGMEYRIGNSSGGFDLLDFNYLPEEQWLTETDEIQLSIDLNKRGVGKAITIDIPIYGGGMSYGSISEQVMLSRVMAAKKWNTYISTGEGGYPGVLIRYKENIITQVATGMFGVSEETIKYAPIVEFKYAQGAKPGLGGHLLGDKATTSVAQLRESVPWISLFSPFPFHSVYSVEDHRKHVDWIKTTNPDALVSIKVSTPTDVDMVAVGSYYAGANIVHLDGSYGGTGAAPEIAKKNIAMPIEFAVPKVHKYLSEENIRDEIVVMASGGIRSAYDVAKIIALGADGAILGTAELVALGCTRCSNCERGRGCPFGLTTTDPLLSKFVDPQWGAERISNLYQSYAQQLRDILRKLGLTSITQLRGRKDLLRYTGNRDRRGGYLR
ncbi:MAG: FMN-binding glutamate synthase family protein [Anaerolineales bacterium]|jgi:glutamate synthase domain-containing protein 2